MNVLIPENHNCGFVIDGVVAASAFVIVQLFEMWGKSTIEQNGDSTESPNARLSMSPVFCLSTN